MRLIRQVSQQRDLHIAGWLKAKGYQINTDYALLSDRVQILGKWSQIWHLSNQGANYIIAKQKEANYELWIVALEDSIISIESLVHFLETGEELTWPTYWAHIKEF